MGATLTAGRDAEQLVESRVRAALPRDDGYRVWANVAWTGYSREHGQLTDGEADLVVAHPDRGFLVVETKAAAIRRDDAGRWYAGGRSELSVIALDLGGVVFDSRSEFHH